MLCNRYVAGGPMVERVETLTTLNLDPPRLLCQGGLDQLDQPSSRSVRSTSPTTAPDDVSTIAHTCRSLALAQVA